MSRKRKADEPDRKMPPKQEPQPQPEEKPVEEDPQEYTELVLVVHAANQLEAELFKTELEAHGVPAVLEAEVGAIPGIGAGVPILVPEEYADQAAELIAELESAKPEGNALAEKEDAFKEDEDEDLDTLDELDEDLDDDDLEEEEELEEEDEDWEEEEEEEEEEDDEEWEDDDEDTDDDDA